MGDWVTDLIMPWEDSSTEKQKQAADNATKAQQDASDKALKLQQDQFDYQKSLQTPFFEGGKPAFDAYAKNIMTSVDANGNFTPQESDSYKWKQAQMEKNTGRTLRSLGRSNSSYGMNVMADANKGLASSEYDTQLARLADLTNIARGGASALAGASAGFSNTAGNNLINQGNNQANAGLAGSMMQQNGLYNNQQNLMGLAQLGLKKWGGGGSNSGGGGGMTEWTGGGSLSGDAGGSYGVNLSDTNSDTWSAPEW